MAAHLRTTILALAVLLPLAACSSDDADPPRSAPPPTAAKSTTTRPASTTTTAPTPEEEVEQAYLAATAAYFDAGLSPADDHASVDRYFSDPIHTRITRILADLAGAGRRATFDAAPVPRVLEVSVAAQAAQVESCLIDDTVLVEGAGSVIADDDITSQHLDTSLRREGSSWKVVEQTTLAVWPDGEGCDR